MRKSNESLKNNTSIPTLRSAETLISQSKLLTPDEPTNTEKLSNATKFISSKIRTNFNETKKFNNTKFDQLLKKYDCYPISKSSIIQLHHAKIPFENSRIEKTSTATITKNTYSFDTFFIFISLILSYWLKIKGFTLSIWLLPLPICFLLTKAKLLCLPNSLVFCMMLKICRFFINHYRFIVLLSFITVIFPLLKNKALLILIVSIVIVYLLAKMINKYNREMHLRKKMTIVTPMAEHEVYSDASNILDASSGTTIDNSLANNKTLIENLIKKRQDRK